MTPLPLVLIQIDENSRVSVLQTDDVLVAYVDQREAHDAVVLLPRENQIQEIMAVLKGRYPISKAVDHKDIAIRTIGRLADQAIVVAGMKKEAAE